MIQSGGEENQTGLSDVSVANGINDFNPNRHLIIKS